jgi:pyruvate/2-oxoglutarate dehydrogenase complex dihydrolipoamide acyltransferase (E2) component
MGESRTKISAKQRFIGDKLKKSVTEYPQPFTVTKVDISRLMEYKDVCKKVRPSITLGAFFIKGISIVLESFPNLNSRMEDMDIIVYEDINVGVAMSSNDDLMVCVVHNTQDKDVTEISLEMQGFKDKMEKRHLSNDDIKGGTVTVSSLGKGRSNIVGPILNNDECLMIGFGSIVCEPAVLEDGRIVPGEFVNVLVRSNHYLVNGIVISKFCDAVCEVLENPVKYFPIGEK